MKVKVWKENENINLPKYGRENDACMDIYASSIELDPNKDRVIVHTGLHFELPEDYDMEIRPRSSNTKTDWYMPNSVGTLDEGYRGELLIIFKNRTADWVVGAFKLLSQAIKYDLLKDISLDFPYKEGERIAQLRISKRTPIEWEEVNDFKDLSESERGIGGFGSTN